MRVIGTFDSRAEWLAARRHGLGASDIAALAGVSPPTWGHTPWTVYTSKTVDPADQKDRPNEDMRLGARLEPVILDMLAEDTGHTIDYTGGKNLIVAHDTTEWAYASPDGFAHPTGDVTGPPLALVEAKKDSAWSWDDGIPLHYQAQAQWGLYVTGLDVCYFGVLHPHQFRVYELEADTADQTQLVDIATRFWNDHVTPRVDPDLTADDDLAAVWPFGDEDEHVEIDEDKVARLVEVKAEQKELQEERETLEHDLKLVLAEAAVGTVAGRPAVTWKTSHNKTRFDGDAFKGDNPFMVNRFTKTETVETLDTKAIKDQEPDIFAKYDTPIRTLRTPYKPADDEGERA